MGGQISHGNSGRSAARTLLKEINLFWIVAIVVAVLLVAASLFTAHAASRGLEKPNLSDSDRSDYKGLQTGSRVAFVLAIVLALAATFFCAVGTVGQREVGIVTAFGKITGQTGHGFVVVAPWESIETQTIATQKFKIGPPDGSQCNVTTGLTSFSSETQPVYICATLNWHVNSDDVQHLYKTVGPTFQDTIIPSRVNQAFKDETVKFAAVQIAPHREQIRLDVLAHLKQTLGKYAINADDLNIDDIEFSDQFQKAIDDKQVATQEALAAQNRVAKAQYEADQQAKLASGDARATLIKATAQAKANYLLSRSLTSQVIQYQYVQKLAPTITTIVAPQGTNTILPLGGLTGTSTPAPSTGK